MENFWSHGLGYRPMKDFLFHGLGCRPMEEILFHGPGCCPMEDFFVPMDLVVVLWKILDLIKSWSRPVNLISS